MAAMEDHATLARFEQLFGRPSLKGMLGLSWLEFQHFVAYVFNCAGYRVEAAQPGSGYHMSLLLYSAKAEPNPVARVEVHRYELDPVDQGMVQAFLQPLDEDIQGYMVTTSDFTGPAYEAAAASNGKVRLVNGPRFLRYITYVNGSRLNGAYAGESSASVQPISPACLFAADDLVVRLQKIPRQGKVLAVGNNKGGVAKTTAALNLGFALTRPRRGKPTHRVLLVDMDGQTSLTRSLPAPGPSGGPPTIEAATLADYFRGRKSLAELVRETRFANLFLIPASHDLLKLDSGGSGRPAAELKFVEDLCQLTIHGADGTPPFDWIILDTPPAQSFYTRAAIAAADHVLMPAFAETFAAIGINGLLQTAETMGALMGNVEDWKSKILGCLVGRWTANATTEGALASLRDDLAAKGLTLFQLRIPEDYRVERAHRETVGGRLRNVFRIGSQPGPAARAYEKFSKEILAHANSSSIKAERR